MIEIRPAIDSDAPAIEGIFRAIYGDDYMYPDFYEEGLLKKLIYGDDTVLLAAYDDELDEVVGTASVVLESGAWADLVGEFGRLAVHPKAWGRGIGARLLEARVEAAQDRLHVGFMEVRVAHPYSLANALDHGFATVGFLPLKLLFGERREHGGLLVRYFGNALELRRNHPRIVPEAYPLAVAAMRQVGLDPDPIVDEDSLPYPCGGEYSLRELTSRGYSRLLRIERGRLHHREIFGPLRLHYGFFRLRTEHSHYLLAYRGEHLAAAIGYTHHALEQNVRVFELICTDDEATPCLLRELDRRCAEELDVATIEVDVSAHAPRMQRTLIEHGYLPTAYIPAFAFHEVERLDVVKMQRLLVPLEEAPVSLVPPSEGVARIVLDAFEQREVLPRLGRAIGGNRLFQGLTEEQQRRLAVHCTPAVFDVGERIFGVGDPCAETYLLLEGAVEVRGPGSDGVIGVVEAGECLGEVSLLAGTPHSAEAMVSRGVRAAVLTRSAVSELVRQRPDIGVVLYRNLARGLGEKLRRTDLNRVPRGDGGARE